MPVNIERLYENCPEMNGFDESCQALLEKLMTVTSPMDFGDDFASDEELDRLEQELDRLDVRNPNIVKIKQIVMGLKAKQALGTIFI